MSSFSYCVNSVLLRSVIKTPKAIRYLSCYQICDDLNHAEYSLQAYYHSELMIPYFDLSYFNQCISYF